VAPPTAKDAATSQIIEERTLTTIERVQMFEGSKVLGFKGSRF